MFENLSYLVLQQYWWMIVSLLAALLVFLLFVQGGQTLIFSLAKSDKERTLLINVLGRKWEFTYSTLVTFGGAFFASFPLFYATSFGGAYWVWMIILLCFVLQAVSFEFRSKPKNFLGARTYEIFLVINGVLAPLLIGTAVATFFTGSQFILVPEPVSGILNPTWTGAAGGLELAFDFTRYATFINLSLGVALITLSRLLAHLYFINHIDHPELIARSRKQMRICTVTFLTFFLFFLINILFLDGWKYDADGVVSMEAYKYWHNILEMPLNTAVLLIGIVLVLWGVIKGLFTEATNGIWFAGTGTVLTVFSLLMVAGLNNTCYYPSTADLQSSLTILNSSSSQYTLTAMSYVSLLVPFVLAYIFWAWRTINKKKITLEEIESDTENHIY